MHGVTNKHVTPQKTLPGIEARFFEPTFPWAAPDLQGLHVWLLSNIQFSFFPLQPLCSEQCVLVVVNGIGQACKACEAACIRAYQIFHARPWSCADICASKMPLDCLCIRQYVQSSTYHFTQL